jgi:hypothetical protein
MDRLLVLLEGVSFPLKHQEKYDYENQHYFIHAKVVNPWNEQEILYEIRVEYHSPERNCQVETTGLLTTNFSFSVKHQRRGALVLFHYLEMIDKEYMDSLLDYIIRRDEETFHMLNSQKLGYGEELFNHISDALLSKGLPEIELPSLLIEDIFTEFNVIDQINYNQLVQPWAEK